MASVNNTALQMTRKPARIGLWGAPASGKTTFLAALNIAIMRSSTDLLMFGEDDEATEFLAESTATLTKHRKFPEATATNRPLSWTMHIPSERQTARRFRRPVTEPMTLQFNIDLIDPPGRYFSSTPVIGKPTEDALFGEDDDAAPNEPQDVIDHLSGCDGIVFLFDPIREQEEGDAFDYFQGTLLRIAQRRFGEGRMKTPKLPQHLAVCVTKLDDPQVYRRARFGGYTSYDQDDPYLFPRVKDDAERFFEDLVRRPDIGHADLVLGGINKFFAPERVRYFVTSAIGFYLPSGASRFRNTDYANAVQDPNGTYRIRGAIHPINVVEPLLWLGQCLR